LGKLGLLSGNINNYLFIVLLLLESYYLVTVTITFFIFLLLLESLRIRNTRKSEYLYTHSTCHKIDLKYCNNYYNKLFYYFNWNIEAITITSARVTGFRIRPDLLVNRTTFQNYQINISFWKMT
jgi:hypothetical protein